MLFSAELALVACAAGLYLYDSALLLYCDEGVVSPKGAQGWIVRFGSRLRLRGKELFLPSPLAPHRPVFRLAWDADGAGRPGDRGWASQRRALRPLAPLVWAMALALFVLLPLGFFTRLGEPMLLAAAILLYAAILVALVWLAFARTRLGMSKRRLVGLAFESLVCPPFAINLVRKVSAQMAAREDLVEAARRLLSQKEWERARTQFVARIDEELEAEEEASARALRLRARRQELLQAGPAAQSGGALA